MNMFNLTILALLIPFSMTAQSKSSEVDSVMQHLFLPKAPGAAVLIVQNGDVVLENGYGLAEVKHQSAVTETTNFRMASVSKQFTAMAIMLLVNAHKMTLEDPLSKYFHGLPPGVGAITVGQLLSHSSGIADYEALIPATRKIQVHDEDVLHLIQKKDTLYFPPGTTFRYSNTGYCLAALIVEKVSEEPFGQFMQENIFHPLGMTESAMYEKHKNIAHRAYGYHKKDNNWEFADQSLTSATLGDGGVYTSLEDYRRWGKGLLNHILVPEKLMHEVFGPHASVKAGVTYGYGWFIAKEEDGTVCYFHSGESTGFHNIVYCNRQKKLWIVLFTNRDDDAIASAFTQIAAIMGVQLPFISNGQSLFHWLSRVYGD